MPLPVTPGKSINKCMAMMTELMLQSIVSNEINIINIALSNLTFIKSVNFWFFNIFLSLLLSSLCPLHLWVYVLAKSHNVGQLLFLFGGILTP